METFYGIVGAAFALLAVTAVALWGFGYLAQMLRECLDRVRFDAREVERQKIANQMLSASHWFSEDPSAMAAIKAYGSALRLGFWADGARDEWRRATGRKAP